MDADGNMEIRAQSPEENYTLRRWQEDWIARRVTLKASWKRGDEFVHEPIDPQADGGGDSMTELARDQCWLYLNRVGGKYFLEIHSDGGPWAADLETKIIISDQAAIDQLKKVFRIAGGGEAKP